MTKPFEMMGREQFLKEVVSFVSLRKSGTLTTSVVYLCFPKRVKPFSLAFY